ncbi:MAG: hypothetical protein GX464_05105, partial [Holophagae bacterium]|nr:hypothetical protein [Holophagae bacterium]
MTTHRRSLTVGPVLSLSGSPRFSQSLSWTELGQLASLTYPTCVPLTACTNTMQRTVYNEYQGGRLVAVRP